MKVLIMIDSLVCGGAERSLVSLLPELSARGYDITLMLRGRGGAFEQYVPAGVDVRDFPFSPPLTRRLAYSAALRMPWNRGTHTAELYWHTAGRHLPRLDEHFDVAIAYQQGFPTFYIADKVNADRKIAWVNADIRAVGYSEEFCKRFYERFDAVCGVSDTIADTVIYPGYVPDRGKITTVYDIQNEEMIRRMAGEENPFVPGFHITTVGRLVQVKGHDLALDAARIMRDAGRKFVWHFVGGGALEGELRERIVREGLTDCIVLEGEKTNPYPYMANCDIYVQTSRAEGFGLTIGEAKILGRPIVSTDFPAVHDQIEDGVHGIITGMSGIEIATAVMKLMDDASLRQKLSANAAAVRNTTASTESRKIFNLIEK